MLFVGHHILGQFVCGFNGSSNNGVATYRHIDPIPKHPIPTKSISQGLKRYAPAFEIETLFNVIGPGNHIRQQK